MTAFGRLHRAMTTRWFARPGHSILTPFLPGRISQPDIEYFLMTFHSEDRLLRLQYIPFEPYVGRGKLNQFGYFLHWLIVDQCLRSK